jgi:hypothetical protein
VRYRPTWVRLPFTREDFMEKKCYRNSVCALVLGAATFWSNSARAGVLVSDETSTVVGGVDINSGCYVTCPFTLNSEATIGSVVSSMSVERPTPQETNYTPVSDLMATILNNLDSIAPGSTVYAASTADSGTFSTSLDSPDPITFTFDPTTLSAGTYWLEIYNSDSNGEDGTPDWSRATSLVNTGADGAVDEQVDSDYPGFTNSTAESGIFEVNSSVPEPTSLSVLSLGAMSLLLRRRRRGVDRGEKM